MITRNWCYFVYQYSDTMSFFEQYHQLKDLFDLSREEISIPGSKTGIRVFCFKSANDLQQESPDRFDDNAIKENTSFRYPVFVPADNAHGNKAILYLHGLNERNWNKHLACAKFLAEKTNKPVIMFPLSFHINRGLPEWTDARKMVQHLEIRKYRYPQVQDATLANIALSDRLTESPQRFFLSGLQSANDIMSLMRDIRDGRHPLFSTGTQTDIFAYSISCMMLQAMMISNPGNILGNSKIVFFAGGSLFSTMNGISRYIMDSVAFQSVRNYYMNINGRKPKNVTTSDSWLVKHKFGMAFRALLTPEKFIKKRENAFRSFAGKLMIVAMRDDKVIPLEGIRSAMGEMVHRSGMFRIVHFPYAYMHENPFPVLNTGLKDQVEKAFLSVYAPVAQFLTG